MVHCQAAGNDGVRQGGATISSSPNQGMLALIPAGCCACGNTAFPAQEGAKAQPDPQPSTLLVTFLLEEVLPWRRAHTVCSLGGIPRHVPGIQPLLALTAGD